MKSYIIGIGGSGHRCIEAVMHLTAAGLVKSEELTVMFVDSDSGNGNFDRTKKTLEDYVKVNNFLSSSGTFFKTRIKPATDLERCLWSPLESTERGLPLADDQKNLKNILQYNLMSDEEKFLFNFLYTDKEIKEPLVEGFYGHPSIGSALIAKNLDFSTEPWRTLISNIRNDVKNDEARVFLVASIFGGTGASGFPTISKHLRNTINSSKLKLGGFLLLPYFRFDAAGTGQFEGSLCPDSGSFMAKSKAALFYYDNQRYYDIFDKIYLLGDSYDEFTEMPFSRGKVDQKNKPHIVELYVALAAANFINDSNIGSDQKISLITRGKEPGASTGTGGYRYVWNKLSNAIGQNDELKNRLAQMLRFAVVYTKTYFPTIEGIATSPSGSTAKKSATWYKQYFLDNNIDIQNTKDPEYTEKLKPLYDYCKKFIDWVYGLHLKEDVNSKRLADHRIQLFNISYGSLFDKQFDLKIDINDFHNLTFGNQKNENKSGEIHHVMCKKNNSTAHQNLPFVERFILDLYDHSELK